MTAPAVPPASVVLVVDDEPVVLEMMARSLSSAGYQVYTATDGPQALEVAETLPAAPSVLVTDLRMGPINGADLAAQMTGRWPGLRVLLVSGYDAEHTETTLPFLRKPFKPVQLVQAVAGLLR